MRLGATGRAMDGVSIVVAGAFLLSGDEITYIVL
jgi:hypothetical protein